MAAQITDCAPSDNHLAEQWLDRDRHGEFPSRAAFDDDAMRVTGGSTCGFHFEAAVHVSKMNSRPPGSREVADIF